MGSLVVNVLLFWRRHILSIRFWFWLVSGAFFMSSAAAFTNPERALPRAVSVSPGVVVDRSIRKMKWFVQFGHELVVGPYFFWNCLFPMGQWRGSWNGESGFSILSPVKPPSIRNILQLLYVITNAAKKTETQHQDRTNHLEIPAIHFRILVERVDWFIDGVIDVLTSWFSVQTEHELTLYKTVGLHLNFLRRTSKLLLAFFHLFK